MELWLYVNFGRKPCPLSNSETLKDIFAKLGTNIKHDQIMFRDKEPSFDLEFLRNNAAL